MQPACTEVIMTERSPSGQACHEKVKARTQLQLAERRRGHCNN